MSGNASPRNHLKSTLRQRSGKPKRLLSAAGAAGIPFALVDRVASVVREAVFLLG
jgi:hypothetical protein